MPLEFFQKRISPEKCDRIRCIFPIPISVISAPEPLSHELNQAYDKIMILGKAEDILTLHHTEGIDVKEYCVL